MSKGRMEQSRMGQRLETIKNFAIAYVDRQREQIIRTAVDEFMTSSDETLVFEHVLDKAFTTLTSDKSINTLYGEFIVKHGGSGKEFGLLVEQEKGLLEYNIDKKIKNIKKEMGFNIETHEIMYNPRYKYALILEALGITAAGIYFLTNPAPLLLFWEASPVGLVAIAFASTALVVGTACMALVKYIEFKTESRTMTFIPLDDVSLLDLRKAIEDVSEDVLPGEKVIINMDPEKENVIRVTFPNKSLSEVAEVAEIIDNGVSRKIIPKISQEWLRKAAEASMQAEKQERPTTEPAK